MFENLEKKKVKKSSRKAVILLSGGMDSLVTLAIAQSEHYELCALHLSYKHRTERRERKSFNDICSYYKIQNKLVVDISYLSAIGGSALTDKKIGIHKSNLETKKIPTTYVPFRNANLLSIAVSWAEVIKAEAIFIGAVEEDAVAYPDCRKQFYEAFNAVIKNGSKSGEALKIKTPVISMKKMHIVEKGSELNVPFELSWSCYKENNIACGECDSCAFRLRGFKQVGIRDPLVYK